MRPIYRKSNDKTTTEIYKSVMKFKGEIDTIREEKSLDESHDLSLASRHLDRYLDALEEQYPTLLTTDLEPTYTEK